MSVTIPNKSCRFDFYAQESATYQRRGWPGSTYMPELSPPNEVRVIHEALGIDVLAWADHHVLCGHNIDHRWLSWVCVRDPYRDWESVGGAAEVDGEGASEVEEQSIGAIREG